jgi:hypothetical protein
MTIKNTISQLNKTIAIKSVLAMSTMACVFSFLIWSLIPLVFPSATEIVAYISADIIQLVALPLIMVGQKIMSENQGDNHDVIDSKVTTAIAHLENIITHLEQTSEEIIINQNTIVNLLQKKKV